MCNLYLFIHMTYIMYTCMQWIYFYFNPTLYFSVSSLLNNNSPNMAAASLLRQAEPFLFSDWTVLNFLISLQCVHKQLIRQPPCFCSELTEVYLHV